ncbi:unnamed protein product [Caenorhabditis auriculariae]|uniref:Uncharacterized protein n=1 Tax=Caenorhabditis auriculariae TaxID=2777116 RepID=A0A8S1HBW3_9PELO|nr:unnamed protein product [Caenorhabditis auriculariae]
MKERTAASLVAELARWRSDDADQLSQPRVVWWNAQPRLAEPAVKYLSGQLLGLSIHFIIILRYRRSVDRLLVVLRKYPRKTNNGDLARIGTAYHVEYPSGCTWLPRRRRFLPPEAESTVAGRILLQSNSQEPPIESYYGLLYSRARLLSWQRRGSQIFRLHTRYYLADQPIIVSSGSFRFILRSSSV